MNKVLAFVISILLTVSVFRALNDKPFLGVKGVVSTFSTYEFNFIESKEMIETIKISFDQMRQLWFEYVTLFTEPLDSHNTILSLVLRGVSVIRDGVKLIVNLCRLFFYFLGAVFVFQADILKNLRDLFLLAFELLGFNAS